VSGYTLRLECDDESSVTFRFKGGGAEDQWQMLTEHAIQVTGSEADDESADGGRFATIVCRDIAADDLLDHLLDMSDSADPPILDKTLRAAVERAAAMKEDDVVVDVG
jgi:hypothetical protein